MYLTLVHDAMRICHHKSTRKRSEKFVNVPGDIVLQAACLYCLCNSFDSIVSAADADQLPSWLDAVTGSEGWFFAVGSKEVPLELRKLCVRSMVRVFDTIGQYPKLERCAFMWFDNLLTFFGGTLTAVESAEVVEEIVDVISIILQRASSTVSVRSALHGANHLMHFSGSMRARLEEWIRINATSFPQDLLTYAERCLDGVMP